MNLKNIFKCIVYMCVRSSRNGYPTMEPIRFSHPTRTISFRRICMLYSRVHHTMNNIGKINRMNGAKETNRTSIIELILIFFICATLFASVLSLYFLIQPLSPITLLHSSQTRKYFPVHILFKYINISFIRLTKSICIYFVSVIILYSI